MGKPKILAGVLIVAIILAFVYVGNLPLPMNLENKVSDYFGLTVQAATTSGVALSATVSTVLTVSVDNDTNNFGNLTPGTPKYYQLSASLFSNNDIGYNIRVNRNNNPTSTLTLGGLPTTATNTIPDATSWDSTGDGNATTTPGATLSFRVRKTESTQGTCYDSTEETWWGSDNPILSKYAGFPTSTTNIINFNCTSYQSATTTAVYWYRLDAPANQYTGDYSGGITYTITAN